MLFTLPEDKNWKDVKGFEGLYKVNKLGEVMRVGQTITTKGGWTQKVKSKILKPYQGQVYLCKNSKSTTLRVCNIVAEAFMDGYVPGQKVYHIKGDSDSLDNLSLTLVSETTDDGREWKDIPGYEGYYQASTDGQIRSLDRDVKLSGSNVSIVKHGKLLAQHIGNDGYLHAALSVNGSMKLWLVHRLMALTFLDNPENKEQVNHIDGVKTNNILSNLEWVTASENMVHAKEHGLWNPIECGNISRTLTGIKVICTTDNKQFDSISKAAKFYKMDFESVKESIKLQRPRKGKQFAYLEEN